MRAAIASAVAALVGVLTPELSQRYVVVPTGRAVDTDTYPCRAALSANGTVVAFDAYIAFDAADANRKPDVYVLDRATNQVTLVSRSMTGSAGRDGSRCPSLSGDGQRIAFESDASDLVDGDVPGTTDVFVYDRGTARLRRITPPAGSGPRTSARVALSADGRFIVFDASATTPPDQRRHVFRAKVDTPADVADLGEGYGAATNGDGSVVAFVTRTGSGQRQSVRVVSPYGVRAVDQPDGRSGDGDTYAPSLSADGQWIAYVFRPATASERRTQPATAQVFTEHVAGGRRYLVSTTHRNREGNGLSGAPVIDATGTRVVFESSATNLACGSIGTPACDSDINLLSDVFLWNRITASVTRINAVTDELLWLEGGSHPTISANGRAVAFLSRQPVSRADGRDTFDLFVTQ